VAHHKHDQPHDQYQQNSEECHTGRGR
jgi:hypothetical protein